MNVAIDTSAARARTSDGSGPGCFSRNLESPGYEVLLGLQSTNLLGWRHLQKEMKTAFLPIHKGKQLQSMGLKRVP